MKPVRIKTIELYTFDQLDETAKENARNWWKESGLDYEWWDCLFDDAKEIGKLIGIEIDNIYFSGFSNQGDGAQFTGEYSYRKQSVREVKKYAPQDVELHTIVENLFRLQRKSFYSLSATVVSNGKYSHALDTTIRVYNDHDYSMSESTVDILEEYLRDYMHWIYCRLEKEYDDLMSDERIDENILINEYSFTENGRIV